MKRGIASEMLEFARRFSKESGKKALRLDVAVQNAPAIALYEKHGYRYMGTVDLGLPYEHLKWFKLYELLV